MHIPTYQKLTGYLLLLLFLTTSCEAMERDFNRRYTLTPTFPYYLSERMFLGYPADSIFGGLVETEIALPNSASPEEQFDRLFAQAGAQIPDSVLIAAAIDGFDFDDVDPNLANLKALVLKQWEKDLEDSEGWIRRRILDGAPSPSFTFNLEFDASNQVYHVDVIMDDPVEEQNLFRTLAYYDRTWFVPVYSYAELVTGISTVDSLYKIEFGGAMEAPNNAPVEEEESSFESLGLVEKDDTPTEEEFIAEHPFLGKFNLTMPMSPQGAALGYATGTNAMEICNVLNYYQHVFELPVNFFPSFLPEFIQPGGDTLFAVYGRPLYPNFVVAGDRIDYVEVTPMGMSGSPEMTIILDETGAVQFEDLTRMRAGKHIGIQGNWGMYVVAQVTGSIPDGRLSLTGNSFETYTEMRFALELGSYPVPFEVGMKEIGGKE